MPYTKTNTINKNKYTINEMKKREEDNALSWWQPWWCAVEVDDVFSVGLLTCNRLSVVALSGTPINWSQLLACLQGTYAQPKKIIKQKWGGGFLQKASGYRLGVYNNTNFQQNITTNNKVIMYKTIAKKNPIKSDKKNKQQIPI